jgi:hypothetical protein
MYFDKSTQVSVHAVIVSLIIINTLITNGK